MTVHSDLQCSIADCSGHAFGRGWCARHYAIWQTYGDPLHPVRRYVRQGATCSHEGCEHRPKRRGLCEKHAKRMAKHGETTDPRDRHFWAQVDKDGPVPEGRPDLGPCWVWTGYVHEVTGYGQFGVHAGTRLPHRIAYQFLVGPIPKGKHLDHLCRRRTCCRPSHLEPVTPRENIRRGDQGAFWGYVPDPVPAKPKAAKPTVCSECASADKPVYKSGRCRPCYRKWLKDPSVERPAPRTPEQRFWEKVDKTDGCWLWTASINQQTGYGRFGPRHGVATDAHRYSYELANGPVPAGLDVHHTCHMRRCVNPAHLQALTRSENLRLRKVRRT